MTVNTNTASALKRSKLAFSTYSPVDIIDCANQLGISLTDEAHLLGVAKAMLTIKVPLQWKRTQDQYGRQVYVDKTLNQPSTQHPKLKEASELLANLRSQPPPEGSSQQSIMQFRRLDGSTFYYDFHQANQLPEGAAPPDPATLIMDVSEEALKHHGLVGQPEDPVSGIKKLVFYSWWQEDAESKDLTMRVNVDSVVGGGLESRYVVVEYDLASQAFDLGTRNEDQELKYSGILAVTSKAGGTVDAWDLHCGATINILGKPITLMKASLETSQWHAHHYKRLTALKKELLETLQKYKPRAHKMALTFDRGGSISPSIGEKQPAALCLRYTVVQIMELAEDLEQYRPSLAEAYRARIEISI